MIIVQTLCAGCGREIEEDQEAIVQDGVPFCCESCSQTGQCDRGCGTDIVPEEPQTTDPCL